nr:hypothetical protein [Bacillus cereus]
MYIHFDDLDLHYDIIGEGTPILMIHGFGVDIFDIDYLTVTKLRRNDEKWTNFKQTYSIDYTPTITKYEKASMGI